MTAWAKLAPSQTWWFLALVLVAGVQQYRVMDAKGELARLKTDWAVERADLAGQVATAEAANRAEEQRRQTAVNGVADDARKQEVAAAPGVAAASAAADRLRDDASKLVATASGVPGDSGIAARSEANRRAAMVLSGLLDRAVERNRELAKGLDDARRRGLTCERAYGALNASTLGG